MPQRESGTNGALDYLRRHRPDKNTYVINLDNLGSGHLAAVTQEGNPRQENSLPGTPGFSAKLAAEEKRINLQLAPYHLLTTDGTVFLSVVIPPSPHGF